MIKKINLFITVLIFAICLTGCHPEQPSKENGLLSVVFIETGNSDSIFINFPDNRKMLIDAGNANDKKTILNILNSYNTKKLDYVVVSHQHDDHIGALPEVLKVYDFDKIYMPDSPIKNDTFDEVVRTVNKKDKTFERGKSGIVLSDDIVYAEILSPMFDHYGEENNYSIVLFLKYGQTSFLFMGDAEHKVENDLLNKNMVPKATVLKVGHHGSHSSSSKNFLNALKPEYAVITTGENSYGHPSKKVVDMLHAMNIKTYRTDLSGTTTFTSDGNAIQVSSASNSD